MFYENTETGEFGISFYDATRLANASAPIDAPEIGVFRAYAFTDVPEFNRTTQEAVEVAPVNGKQQWEIRALSPAAVAANRAARAEGVRFERNQRLSECDWTQVADAPVDKEAWAAYRQALRDISQQPGFPDSIDWPVAP